VNCSHARRSGLARFGEPVLLAAIVLLAFTRGVWALGAKSLWWDESLSLYRAQSNAGSILSGTIILTDNVATQVTVDDHPPLYFLLLAVSVRLFGTSEFALRYLSLACMVLTVGLLYISGRRLVGRGAGLAAAFLGAVSPMYLWYGQEARPYALVTFLGLLSFYCFVRAFVGLAGVPEHRIGKGTWAAGYVLGSVCMVLTHYLSILLILFEMAVLGIQLIRIRKRRWLFLASILAVLLGISLAVGYALLRLPGGIDSVQGRAGVQFVPLRMLTRDLLNSFSLGLSVDVGDWYVWLADLLFLGFVVLGLLRLVLSGKERGGKLSAGLLAGYLAVPIALIHLFSYIQPAYMTSRHLMLVTPAFYLLLASGLSWMRGRLGLVSIAGWALVIAGVTYSTVNYFGPEYDKDPHREWGAYLREHVRLGDVVVVDPPHIAQLYSYYASSEVPWIGLPLLGKSQQQTEERLRELLQEYERVWLAYSQTPYWGDPNRLPENWLNQHAYRVDYRAFESHSSQVLLAAYLPETPLLDRVPDSAHGLEVRYPPSLRLVGYQPLAPARAAASLHVQLYWAVDEPVATEASISLRLVDGEGHLVGQSDQCPFNGLFPMWQWAPGKIVRAEQEVLVRPGTPPGPYQLEMVLIEHPGEQGCLGPAGRILPPVDAPAQVDRGDRAFLGTIEVGRAETPISRGDLDIERLQRVRFGDLELVGSTVGAAQLMPGERIDLRLYWRARRGSLPDMQFRLALKGSSGQILAERVIRPAGDGWPATLWQPQDSFEGQFWLRVPVDALAGEYSLVLAPVAPAQRSGLWGAVVRRLRPGSNWVQVDECRVEAAGSVAASTPAATVAPPQGLAIEHPMLATLGDQVRFLGYDIDSATVEAGQPLTVTLYWQALLTMDVDYTVFTHLLGPGNEVLGQEDSQPRSGTYPTTHWQPGEVIADTYSFLVGPDTRPGAYPLEVGMYRLETETRLSVVGADGQRVPDDRILLEEVTITAPATAVPTPLPVLPEMPYRIYLPQVEASPQ